MNYCINVDWLQVYCSDQNTEDLSVHYYSKSSYEFEKRPYGSRHFAEIWDVKTLDGDNYAVIQRCPLSSILSTDGSIVQLCNRELYKSFWVSEFLIFLASHGFRVKSISRLDVCFDSNILYNGLKHSTLIKKIMSGEYLKNNQANVKWNFSSIANVGRPMECNSCSFGSKTSAVSSKMYNKTLELRECKNKPYIVENWRFNDLDTDKDVWRIEISIKSDARTLIKIDSGEIFRLNPDSLKFQQDVEDVFFSYAAKYFSFKRNDGKKNKSRMADVQLFPTERTLTMRPVRITFEKDSSRSDRIFIKKLHRMFKEIPMLDAETEKAIWQVSHAFVLGKSLVAWREQMLAVDDMKVRDEDTDKGKLLIRLRQLLRDIRLSTHNREIVLKELGSLMYNYLKDMEL